jgi:hypothetical protein
MLAVMIGFRALVIYMVSSYRIQIEDQRCLLSAITQAFASLPGLCFASLAFRVGRLEDTISRCVTSVIQIL